LANADIIAKNIAACHGGYRGQPSPCWTDTSLVHRLS